LPTVSSPRSKPRPTTTMLNREQALALVLRRLAALGRELGKPVLEQADEQTRLFGEAAALDSIGLVTLIADLEEDIRVATGKTVTLADEKAMSRLTSPFRRVDLLAEYVVEIVAR
jgi:acyl carrier protein